MEYNNKLAGIRIATCFFLFVLLVCYFTAVYSFYPGLSLGFHGTVERSVSGGIYWDFGSGFTDLDYIPITLFSDNQADNGSLGAITIESSGLKNDKSRDDMVWLVLSEQDLNSGKYVIEGRHQWMHWLTISANMKGRQLALFPGSKITLTNELSSASLRFFKTPDSGIVRITSKNGPERFYDGYGENKRFAVSHFIYHRDAPGRIDHIVDPFRMRNLCNLPLPHQKIRGLKFVPVKEDLITGVDYIEDLTIRPSLRDDDTIDVVITNIKINGKKLGAGAPDTEFNLSSGINQYIFDADQQYIKVNRQISNFVIEYLPGNYAKPLKVWADGNLLEDVSYLKKSDGTFQLRGQAHIHYRGLTLNSLDIKDAQGETTNYTFNRSDIFNYSILNLGDLHQRQFSLLLFSVQIISAAIVSLLLYWLSTLVPFEESSSLKSLLLNVFLHNGRWLFWLLLILGSMINFLWLFAEWPGSLTPDSVHVHSGIKQLKITNHHPYIYSLFILGLYNIYDSLLTIIIVQIITYNCLVAAFMYILFKNGINWWIILPLCCLIFLLIPVNLFNITVWKDIPFTILVLFWAFFITVCFYKKLYKGTFIQLGNIELILLVILFVSLCAFRHNGVIYICYIPICLLLFSNIKKYWIMKFVGLSAVFFSLYYFVIPPFVLVQNSESNDFAKNVTERTLRNADINEKQDGFYLENYLGDRVEKFIASLGTSPKASTWYNDMHNPPQRWFSVDELRSSYKTHPTIEKLQQLKNKLLQSREYKGFTKGRFIHWNSLFSLFGMIIIFLLYKWLPLSALYSSFFLYQTAALFFVVWARWRYMYFLYLGGFFLIFVVLLELRSKRRSQR